MYLLFIFHLGGTRHLFHSSFGQIGYVTTLTTELWEDDVIIFVPVKFNQGIVHGQQY